jgi:lauroyl/myristoyl acyltransferase
VGEAVTKAGQWLRRAEGAAYWLVVAPLAARLPARLGYGIACLRGDLSHLYWRRKRAEIVRDLRAVLGDELTQNSADRVARDLFRFRACDVIDVMRLRSHGQPLLRLVEIRGREHLEAALAAGKGAILCGAHVGSFMNAYSVIHASGFPVTTIGRWDWKYDPAVSATERRFWEVVYARRVLRHRTRPNLEPWPGRVQVAVQAAAALRANEVVTICSDAAPLSAERPRGIDLPFLGRQARMLPGVVTMAKLTGAPVLMTFMHRSPDYRHQTLEISPPVPMDGDTETAFARCAAAIEAAIMRNPAGWNLWFEAEVLTRLGLLPEAPSTESPADDLRESVR